MGTELDPIRRAFGPDDLAAVARDNGVERTLLVQTVSSVEETQEFLATAAEHELVGGVVGWVDLTDGSAERTIIQLRSGPDGEKLVGVRHQVQDEKEVDWLLRPEVQRSIAAIGDAGLVFDLLVRIDQLPSAVQTVRRHRHMQFVLDHAAKPRIEAGTWDAEWEKAMAPFAGRANVACKISGLVTEADWKRWTPAQLEPYVTKVLEWFGPERCMFGSDWPVCLLAASYSRVLQTIRQLVGEDEDVFSLTATRVYGLIS
jgi:L-fuconolactonase